jgi:hypothetical protein
VIGSAPQYVALSATPPKLLLDQKCLIGRVRFLVILWLGRSALDRGVESANGHMVVRGS